MPIGYQNEVGACVKSEGLEEGHWYVDAEGALFIVPDERFGLAEIEGPDGEVCDALNDVYRAQPFEQVDPQAVATRLGLTVVYGWQRRFDAQAGYYCV